MKNILHAIVILTLAPYCAGCTKVTEEEFIGTYCLRYGEGVEKLEINADRTYKLTYNFLGKFVFNYDGIWELEKREEDGELFVSFINFIHGHQFFYNRYDFWKNKTLHELNIELEKKKNQRDAIGRPGSYTPSKVFKTLSGRIIIPTDADRNIDYIKIKGIDCE